MDLLTWALGLPHGPVIVPLAVVVLVGVVLMTLSNAFASSTGLPSAAKILGSDTGQERVRQYRSERLKLGGNPDFVIEERVGLLRRPKMVPVEVKSWSSPRLYDSQKVQIAAYLALMKEEHGKLAADYGYVIYDDTPFRVDWSRDLARWLADMMEGAREVKRTKYGTRTHENPAQCAKCAFRKRCEESLA